MSDPVKLAQKIPMEGRVIAGDSLTIQSVPVIGKIMLQRSNKVTDSEMGAFGRKFAQTFGPEFPLKVCGKTVSNDGAITIHCLNPNSWIILSNNHDVATITEWVEDAAQDITITTADMTDQYICLNIEGRYARALLAKGCALDLSDESFHENYVARTLLSQVNIVLWRNANGGYRILFDVSLSDYLWRWLDVTADEFVNNI